MKKASFHRSFLHLVALAWLPTICALNIVIPGGSGKFGTLLASKLAPTHDVTILTRNAFLASAPSRVTEVFGYVGESFLRKHPNVSLRDWDGGDLLDIVGCDWMGWQEDTLKKADVVVNLVGGYTEQRTMATERIVRESLTVNPSALQIAVSPREEDLPIISPGMPTLKEKRLQDCEDMVKANCQNAACLRMECNNLENSCEEIIKVIESQSS
mmetsp:Transcript_28069/g.39458  ORF Transcript_28069/g.39458 Transcript_28069/m.39458 type:complete len:213 (+) Transcript_28069:129-767(+)